MDYPILRDSLESDHISALFYLLQLDHSAVLPEQFEHLLLYVHQCLAKCGFIQQTNLCKLLKSLKNHDKSLYIEDFQVYYRDSWFSKLVVLCSLKHCTNIMVEDPVIATEVLELAITFSPVQKESMHLLKVISMLLDSFKRKIDDDFCIQLFNFAQLVALSPHKFFKQYAEKIALKTLQLSSQTIIRQVQCLDFLPYKGVSTSALGFLATSFNNNLSLQLAVNRVIEMFSNNIENHEGGSLYKIVLSTLPSYDITVFEVVVWPQFYAKLKHLDCEGEFFQSLLKYWIPISLKHYQLEMLNFLCEASIPKTIKGNTLLECRRTGIVTEFKENHLKLIESLLADATTHHLGFQIITLPNKKLDYPTLVDVSVVIDYLEGESDYLSPKQLQALEKFCIGALTSHPKYMKILFELGVSMLKTQRSGLGAQILLALAQAANKYDGPLTESAICNLKQSLQCEKFKTLIKEVFVESCASEEYLSKLIVIGHDSTTLSNEMLLSFIDKLSENVSIQAYNSVKNATFCIATLNARVEPRKNDVALELLFAQLFQVFSRKNFEITDLFKATLLFESLKGIYKYSGLTNPEYSDWICNVCFLRVARILSQKTYREEQGVNSNDNRTEKTLEALYNILCECLMENTSITASANFPSLTAAITEVIEHSSMRKPTTTSATLLKHLFSGSLDLKDLKIQLLSDTITKLKGAVSVQNLTIRRNPETRLIIHALCASDFTPQKTLLNFSLSSLLHILDSEKGYADATVSATLHCLEILISDNTLYASTMKDAPEAILQCVRHFKNQNWVVRNACIQLEKALIDRFLGVHTSSNNRAKNVEDLFQLFPQLVPLFYDTLVQEPQTDSMLAVMQFFSESQVKPHPFPITPTLDFPNVFLNLVKQNSTLYGIFACRAYLSLCPENNIPSIIQDVVQDLLGNFDMVRQRNTLRNYLVLLQELRDKYQNYVSHKPEVPKEWMQIQQSFTQLTGFLKQFNQEQFDFLLVQVLPTQEVLAYLQQPKQFQRLSLHNYVPYLLVNSSSKDLPEVVESVLLLNLPECLQVKVLGIIVDRSQEVTFQLVEVLLLQSLQLSSRYILMCYFKTILLLFDDCAQRVSSKLLEKARENYKSNQELYKTFIVLIVLSTLKEKSDVDRHFIKLALKQFITTLPTLTDDDLVDDMSESLKYLYLNLFCSCDRKRILKLALKLLLEEGKFHFITFAAQVALRNPRVALKCALSYHFLTEYLEKDMVAYDFLKEFYSCVNQSIEHRDNATFYGVEDTVYVDFEDVTRCVLLFLRHFCSGRELDYREMAKLTTR